MNKNKILAIISFVFLWGNTAFAEELKVCVNSKTGIWKPSSMNKSCNSKTETTLMVNTSVDTGSPGSGSGHKPTAVIDANGNYVGVFIGEAASGSYGVEYPYVQAVTSKGYLLEVPRVEIDNDIDFFNLLNSKNVYTRPVEFYDNSNCTGQPKAVIAKFSLPSQNIGGAVRNSSDSVSRVYRFPGVSGFYYTLENEKYSGVALYYLDIEFVYDENGVIASYKKQCKNQSEYSKGIPYVSIIDFYKLLPNNPAVTGFSGVLSRPLRITNDY